MLFCSILQTGGNIDFSTEVPRNFYEVYTTESGVKSVKSGWSSKNNNVIWEKLKLDCCFGFRRIKHGAHDICVSDGYCRQKNCSISITTTLSHNSQLLNTHKQLV